MRGSITATCRPSSRVSMRCAWTGPALLGARGTPGVPRRRHPRSRSRCGRRRSGDRADLRPGRRRPAGRRALRAGHTACARARRAGCRAGPRRGRSTPGCWRFGHSSALPSTNGSPASGTGRRSNAEGDARSRCVTAIQQVRAALKRCGDGLRHGDERLLLAFAKHGLHFPRVLAPGPGKHERQQAETSSSFRRSDMRYELRPTRPSDSPCRRRSASRRTSDRAPGTFGGCA